MRGGDEALLKSLWDFLLILANTASSSARHRLFQHVLMQHVYTCWSHWWAIQKWLNKPKYHLGTDSCVHKILCIRWDTYGHYLTNMIERSGSMWSVDTTTVASCYYSASKSTDTYTQ